VLIDLPAHAGIGLKKKSPGCCTGLGGCGQPAKPFKKVEEGRLRKTFQKSGGRASTLISQSVSRGTFLKTETGAPGNLY
jgi:hypothetical protein